MKTITRPGPAATRWHLAAATAVLAFASIGFGWLGVLSGSDTLMWMSDKVWALAGVTGAILTGLTLGAGRPAPAPAPPETPPAG